MKTQYRLIKEYPGSPKVGDIVKGYGRDGWYSKGEGHSTYDWRQIVNYPEYWEEVVEKDYEIISFKQDSGITDLWTKFTGGWSRNINGYPTTVPYTLEDILKNDLYTIYSVKRLSDGEVFTVGDRVRMYTHGPIKTIETITTNSIRSTLKEGVWFTYNSSSSHMDHAIKQTQPIFLTHDGKDIFPEDIVWYVNKENFYLDYVKAYPEVKFNSDIRAYFLTEEEAKKYIIENKPALSIKEFWEITWMETSGFNKNTYMKNLVKQRLNLK